MDTRTTLNIYLNLKIKTLNYETSLTNKHVHIKFDSSTVLFIYQSTEEYFLWLHARSNF